MSSNTTATDSNAMVNIKCSRMRDVAARFLNDTPALHLERELATLLMNIDAAHQIQVKQLELRLRIATDLVGRY